MSLVNGTYLVLGNWKMHLTVDSATQLARQIAKNCTAMDNSQVTVGVAPAFVHVCAVRQALAGDAILLGAQTCHAAAQGAHTGDISANMLANAGCDFVLVGHSERRNDHKETDAQVHDKAQAAIDGGLHAVICVGETLEQREAGVYLDVIEKQLRASLPKNANRENTTVAYEPVWAIGSGKTASNENIAEVHGHIHMLLRQLQGADAVSRVLYGGSVKANNALDILSLPVVDGVLVGGASLDADAFKAIIGAAQSAAQ